MDCGGVLCRPGRGRDGVAVGVVNRAEGAQPVCDGRLEHGLELW